MTASFQRDEIVLPLIIASRAETVPDVAFLRDVEGGSFTYRQLYDRALVLGRGR